MSQNRPARTPLVTWSSAESEEDLLACSDVCLTFFDDFISCIHPIVIVIATGSVGSCETGRDVESSAEEDVGELGPVVSEDELSRSAGAGHTFRFRCITVFLLPTARNFLIVFDNLLSKPHPRHSIGPVLSPRAPGRLHGHQGAKEGEARGSPAAEEHPEGCDHRHDTPCEERGTIIRTFGQQ